MPFPRLSYRSYRAERRLAGRAAMRSLTWDGQELVVAGQYEVLRD